ITNCVTYTGLDVGTDTACILLCDEFNVCDSVTIIVTVEPNLPDSVINIIDTISIDSSVTLCPIEIGYMGVLDTFYNACPDTIETFVDFEIDSMGCVTYTGLAVGTDSLCLVMCDTTLGICDTSIFSITIIEEPIEILAVDDYDTTLLNTPIQVFVLENDSINGDVTSLIEFEPPSNGTLTATDSLIIYIPNEDFCGQDSFMYLVCNATACDTAAVYINIACEDIKIFNAVSANGDGINDFFVIQGIESYPEATVCIFNRWGNMVYEKDGNYANDWNGKWKGEDLSDGTYFYYIDLKDGSKVKTGYLQIHR
ncbi:MAG: gliding motility-associated C-terminal domain-containing protein, partial [Saprospiraceae bacterium]